MPFEYITEFSPVFECWAEKGLLNVKKRSKNFLPLGSLPGMTKSGFVRPVLGSHFSQFSHAWGSVITRLSYIIMLEFYFLHLIPLLWIAPSFGSILCRARTEWRGRKNSKNTHLMWKYHYSQSKSFSNMLAKYRLFLSCFRVFSNLVIPK